ncbi:hypothetical protein K437DRAFT_260411 [Tilletiaria anomala UBC 951]|uniref:Uncharacterized protein n=1 Tax=Tilletiaria anomala (strain ATCC 24038 / CBS 436.72 / UBC 951) TaxID=1037660 RepID=A0A066V0D2_TILAU|nr:uncharacterized protein K437DRAFT_260411 [Tilletiaria anomala UBC 951]KDN35177.1 hypothetical protein K437DRAFT_260411 [Tilletiaria anomala UBC 951]
MGCESPDITEGTKILKLCFDSNKDRITSNFSNSDWAGDCDSRPLNTCYAFRIFGI